MRKDYYLSNICIDDRLQQNLLEKKKEIALSLKNFATELNIFESQRLGQTRDEKLFRLLNRHRIHLRLIIFHSDISSLRFLMAFTKGVLNKIFYANKT